MTQRNMTVEQLNSLRGKPVYASDGDKIGNVEEIYYDAATREPEWIGLGTGFLGMKRVLVPVQGIQLQDGDQPSIVVPYSKDRVKDTPGIDEDEISEDTEQRLYSHYGLQPSERRSETQLPEEREYRPTEPRGEVDVSRYEEEFRAGKREVERGRVRLRKWVETEPASAEVELHEETARVERQAVDRPAPGAHIGEEEAEMRLRGEEAVAGKETVEKERVSLHPEERTRRETVRDEVRKEHVEVEGDTEEEHPERRGRRESR